MNHKIIIICILSVMLGIVSLKNVFIGWVVDSLVNNDAIVHRVVDKITNGYRSPEDHEDAWLKHLKSKGLIKE